MNVRDVLLAEVYARSAHGKQLYGDLPYEEHLRDVVRVLKEFGYDEPNWQVAGWLHDVLEDTDTTEQQLRAMYATEIVDMVVAVSSLEDKPRSQRLDDLINKLMAYPRAIPLKLADRIANVRNCWGTRNPLLFMYHKEYRKFRGGLRRLRPNTGHITGYVSSSELMWKELDQLHGFRTDLDDER